MKTLLTVIFLLLAISLSCFKTAIVPLNEITDIAKRNAAAQWGDVYPDDPIPYYDRNGEIIAWEFNFSIGKPFPDREELKNRCRNAGPILWDSEWNKNDFAHMTMGARTNQPVIIGYAQELSYDYSYLTKMEKLADRDLNKPYKLEKMVYVNLASMWFVVSDNNGEHYIKAFPPPKVLNYEDFYTATDSLETPVIPIDFSDQWSDFGNGRTLDRSYTFIPNYEKMPFYRWVVGCSPCSGAMLSAWWDNNSDVTTNVYSKLNKYHFKAIETVTGDTLYHIPECVQSIGYYMDTDDEGGTQGYNIDDGMLDFFESRGYDCWTDNDDLEWEFLWDHDDLFYAARGQINQGKPLLLEIPGHSVCGMGYNTSHYLALHDPNSSVINFWYQGSFDMLTYVHPSGGYGSACKLVYPVGGKGWMWNYPIGEFLYNSCVYDIRWEGDFPPGSYAKLWYHPNHGIPITEWVSITDNTPNNGSYSWIIPSGTVTDSCRIKIEIYSSTDQLIGADGTYGEFYIRSVGSLQNLTSGTTSTTSTDPKFCTFQVPDPTWAVIAAQPDGMPETYSMLLYEDSSFTTPICGSALSGFINLIAIDRHHAPDNIYALKMYSMEGGVSSQYEYEGSPEVLQFGTNPSHTWGTYEIARMWDITLDPGIYKFTLHYLSRSNNLDIALFSSHASNYRTLSNTLASANSQYGGVDETFVVNITTSDIYGFCVYSESPAISESFDYNITVEPPGYWLGFYNSAWTNSSNWSSGSVPTSSDDIYIPASALFQPKVMGGVTVECGSLSILDGASLEVANGTVNIHGSMDVYGTLNVSDDAADVNCLGHIHWYSGSEFQELNSGTINVQGNWTVDFGSDVVLTNTTVNMNGAESGMLTIKSDISNFGNLCIDKTLGRGVAIADNYTIDVKIQGDLIINSNSYLHSNMTDITLKGDLISNGELEMDNNLFGFTSGGNQNISCQPTDYFHDFLITNPSTAVNLQSNIVVNGDVLLNNGSLNADNYSVTVYGDWDVLIGTYTGDVNSRVIFRGETNSVCDDEAFQVLELAKIGTAELDITGGKNVVCQSYDWTSGVINVNGGSFTAFDLADIRIMGGFILAAGVIELYQDENHYVDLDANLWIYSGTMNIHGGYNFPSEWAYTRAVQVYMENGVLDFIDNGIYLRPTGYYLNTYITGGQIKTSGDFKVERSGFSPTGGYVKMYGEGSSYLHVNPPSSLYKLVVTKSSSRNAGNNFERTDQVIVNSNTTIFNDLNVYDGILQISHCNLTIGRDLTIYSGLMMDDTDEAITAGRNITFNSGSGSTILNGTLTLGGDWTYNTASTATVTSPATIIFTGSSASSIYAGQTTTQLGNLTIQKIGASCTLDNTSITDLININDLVIMGSSSYIPSNKTYNITGKVDIKQYGSLPIAPGTVINTADFYEAGLLTMTGGTINISTNYTQYTTGNNQVSGGELIINSPYTGALHAFAGTTNLSGGTFQITNNGIQFGTVSNFVVTNSGRLKLGWGLRALYPGTFVMTSGSIEFMGTLSATIEMAEGNQISSMYLSKTGTSGNVYLMTDAYVLYGCYINSGKLLLNHNKLTVGRNISCNGQINASNGDDELWVGGSWISDNGTSSLVPGSGTVTFYSAYDSQIGSDVNFNKLVIDKQSTRSQTITINNGINVSVADSLTITNGTLELRASSQLDVSGDLVVGAGAQLAFYSGENNMQLQVDGQTTIANTGSMQLVSFSNVIFTGDLSVSGNLDIGNSYVTLHGYLTTGSASSISIANGHFVCDAPNNMQYQYMNGTLNMTGSSGQLEFTNLSLQFTPTSINSISNGTISIGGSLYANATNILQPTGGTFMFNGLQNSSLYCANGSWLHDIIVNMNTYTLIMSADLHLLGSMQIYSGAINPVSYDIYCGGSWTNYVGDSGFLENNSTLYYQGLSYAWSCSIASSETFYNVVIELDTEFNESCLIAADQTVNVLNDLTISSGALELDDNAVLVVGNDITIASGCCLNLEAGTNASLSFSGDLIDYNASRYEYAGLKADLSSTTILIGSQDQEINTSAPGFRFHNLTINKTAGTAFSYDPFTVTGDFYLEDGSWNYEVSGLTNTFEGDFTVSVNGVWNDDSGTVSFEGDQDSEIAIYGSCSFGNFNIEKQVPSASVSLVSDCSINSVMPLNVMEGILNLNGHTLSPNQGIQVIGNGTLRLTGNSILNMPPYSSLEIVEGGVLETIGTPGNNALITNQSDFHDLDINYGSTISAEYTIFENMSYQGVNITSGSMVDPNHCFTNCEFRYGMGFGTLLTINNNQNLNIVNPVFISGTGQNESMYNLAKTVDSGSVTISGDSGAFTGNTHENDPYQRINWSTDVPVIDIIQDELNFETVEWSEETEEYFDITNTGDGTLIGSIETPDGFTVTEVSRNAGFEDSRAEQRDGSDNTRNICNFMILPMASASFMVSFMPDHPGVYDGDLTINHNGPGGLYIIHLYAQSIGPMAELDNDNFDLGLLPGDSSDFNLTLNNAGTDSLYYSAEVFNYSRNASGNNHLSRDHEPSRTDWLTIDDSLYVSGSINPGSPKVFDLHVDASDLTVGWYYAEIYIYTNDPINSYFYIYVNLAVGYPDIDIMYSYLDFGMVPVGSDSTQSFFIDNFGEIQLSGTITTPEGYSVIRIDEWRNGTGSGDASPGGNYRNALDFTIDAGLSGEFEVTFTPQDVQNYDGNLVVSSNAGPDEYLSLLGSGIGLPAVTTNPVTVIHALSASCSGTVNSDGGLQVLERGICWNTTGNPSLLDDYCASEDSLSEFSCEIDSLDYATEYYVRAYAINDVGIDYGGEVSFTTLTPNLVVSTDSLADFGHVPVGQVSAEATFTVSGENLVDAVLLSVLATSGFEMSTQSGARETLPFGSELTLYPDGETLNEQTIFVRFHPLEAGYVSVPLSIITTGGNVCEISLAGTGIITPQVSIGEPFNIYQETATVGALVSDNGFDPVTDCGVCWSLTENPSLADAHTSEGPQTDWFFSQMTPLLPNTLYYARAYATNLAGTSYSGEVSFTTVTNPALAVSDSMLAFFGRVVVGEYAAADTFSVSGEQLLGDITVTAPAGFQVALSDSAGSRDYASVAILSPVNGTIDSTDIYVRFAPQTGGNLSGPVLISTPGAPADTVMVYGIGVTLPEVSTLAATDITTESAMPGGMLTFEGFDEVTETGILVGTEPLTYGLSDITLDPSEVFIEYYLEFTGLESGTTYYYVAYAINSAGTAYGEEMSFTTATGFLAAPQNLTIVMEGGEAVLTWDAVDGAISYLVYRSTEAYPSDWGTAIAVTDAMTWSDSVLDDKYFYMVKASSEPVSRK